MAARLFDGFSPYQKRVLIILGLIQLCLVLDFMIIAPLGDFLIKSLDINTRQFGLIVSSYAFSAAITGIIAATFIDRFERRSLLLAVFFGFIVSTFACGWSDSYATLLVARVLTGMFAGITSALVMTIVTDLFAPNQRGRAMSVVQMGFAVSQIIGIPAGIWFASAISWHASFYLIVVLAGALLIAMVMLIQPVNAQRRPADHKPLWHLWQTLKNRHYQTGFVAVAFLTIGGYLMMPFSAVFLVNNVKMTYDQLPLIFFFTGVSSLIVMPIVGSLSDRIDRFKLFAVGSSLAAVMVGIYAHLPVSPLWWVIVVNVLLFATIMCRMNPAMALNSMVPQAQDRGAYMSICSSLQQIAGGIASVIAGMIVIQPSEHSPLLHFDRLGDVAIGVFLLCIVLLYRVNKSIKLRHQAE